MIWYLLIQILAVLFYIGVIFVWYKFRKDKLDDFIEFSMDRWKILLIAYFVIFTIVTIFLFVPLKNTTKCAIHGNSMNTETKYSWVMGSCLMKTRTGAWLPINISRDQPEGEHHDSTDLTN
jgi:hypothetical protein